MKIGYARVSSTDQNLARQIKALKKAECEKIFDDRIQHVSIRLMEEL